MKPAYARILLKISGESFGTPDDSFSLSEMDRIVDEIVAIHKQGVEIGIVMGGGNIIRGAFLEKRGIHRTTGDSMGMLATVINAVLLQELLRAKGAKACILNARHVEGIGEPYRREKCMEYLAAKSIVLFAGGTGYPYVTTDTAAAIRAKEMEAECLLKGTKVDGIYKNYGSQKKQKIDFLTYEEALQERYGVMDLTAFAFCLENKIPILVFNLMEAGNLQKIISGKTIGTLVAKDFKQSN